VAGAQSTPVVYFFRGLLRNLVEVIRTFVHETADGEPEDDITILACVHRP
jgi:hypothetical protein